MSALSAGDESNPAHTAVDGDMAEKVLLANPNFAARKVEHCPRHGLGNHTTRVSRHRLDTDVARTGLSRIRPVSTFGTFRWITALAAGTSPRRSLHRSSSMARLEGCEWATSATTIAGGYAVSRM